jgi:sugar/nucleoside kinase (ribokinase family)
VSAPFVAVVGTVNLDTIITAEGRRLESLGGILYNAIPLAALLENTGVLVKPWARLGPEHREWALRLLEPFPAVDARTLIADPNGTNRSVLDYSEGGERREEVSMRVAALSPDDLLGTIPARAVLVNMISGRDITPETLAAIRRRSGAHFLLDVQALARTFDTPRRPRIVPHREEWCRLFDVVRGNEEEIAHFGGVPEDATAAAERILRSGVGQVITTRGEKGSWHAVLVDDRLAVVDVPPDPWEPTKDPTGCGDSFLAGVCAGRVVGMSPAAAVRLGSFTAGKVAALSGLESLGALRGIGEEAARRDPEWAALALRFGPSEGPGGAIAGPRVPVSD